MSRLSDPTVEFFVTPRVVIETLSFLRQKGVAGDEGVVLWPGSLSEKKCLISEPLFPAQEAGPLHYRIPDEEVFRVLEFVSARGLVIPIQVHSHPREAFHSYVDDERAFVQHENAISIVVPDFGRFPDQDFVREAVFYRLEANATWREMSRNEIRRTVLFKSI